MSLLFNMLSRLVVTFLPRNKCLNFMTAITIQFITSGQIDGAIVETVTDFIFLGSKITAGGDRSHEIKRHLLLGKKL